MIYYSDSEKLGLCIQAPLKIGLPWRIGQLMHHITFVDLILHMHISVTYVCRAWGELGGNFGSQQWFVACGCRVRRCRCWHSIDVTCPLRISCEETNKNLCVILPNVCMHANFVILGFTYNTCLFALYRIMHTCRCTCTKYRRAYMHWCNLRLHAHALAVLMWRARVDGIMIVWKYSKCDHLNTILRWDIYKHAWEQARAWHENSWAFGVGACFKRKFTHVHDHSQECHVNA